MPFATQSSPLRDGQSTVQALAVCTDYGVPVGTYFGDGISAPPGYSFMLRPTKTVRPGAGENIGRALSQKKLSYHA